MLTLTESPSNRTQWAALDRMMSELQHPTKRQLDPVQEAIRDAFLENFQDEASGGTPWEPLSFATVIDRIRLGFPGEHPILRRTGHYQSSWVDALHNDHVSEVQFTGDGFVLSEGSKDARAAHLEPDRPVALLNNGQTNRVGQSFVEMVNGIINRRT